MSLPRGNYDPRRVCINPFPEITLGKHKRTVGVYLAGALVRVTLIVVVILPNFLPPVRASKLDFSRRRRSLCSRQVAMGATRRLRHLRRLASRIVLSSRHADRQPH